MEDFLATVLPRPADTGEGISGQLPPNRFCASPKFVVLRKICFKHMVKTKIFPPKNAFSLLTLKSSHGPGSAKIVSAIRIFCFEGHSASRCGITSKTFFINHH